MAYPRGTRRQLRAEGQAVLEREGEPEGLDFTEQRGAEKVFLPYEGPESLPPFDPDTSNTYKKSRFFVTGYKSGTMKLIRVYRGAPSGKRKEGDTSPFTGTTIKHQLVTTFQPLNKKKPRNTMIYERLKKAGLIRE